MGDYTTLKFKAELTDAGRDVVADLIKLWNGDRDAWVTAIEAAPDVFYSRRSNPFLADGRRNFIPFGAVPYPPEHMEDLWCKNVNRLTAHTWSVVCSVKTQSTIDNFLTGVLPYMLEANCLAKTWGEESSEPVEQLIKPRRPPMTLIGTLNYEGEELSVSETTYPESGTTAVVVENELGMRYCTVSVYVEDVDLAPTDFVVTHNLGDKLQKALLESGLFEETNMLVSYGFIKDQPVWRLHG